MSEELLPTSIHDPPGAEIRSATEADAAAIRDIYEPFVTGTAISFESEPPDVPAIARRIRDSHAWLVCTGGGRILGYAYAAPFHSRAGYRWSVEVSVYVAGDAQGAGAGRSLLTSLLDQLTQRGFVNAFAGIALPNPASVHLFESLGFEQIGLQKSPGFKLGAWHDVGWWQRQLRPPGLPPPPLDP